MRSVRRAHIFAIDRVTRYTYRFTAPLQFREQHGITDVTELYAANSGLPTSSNLTLTTKPMSMDNAAKSTIYT